MRNGQTAQSVKDVQKELQALRAKLNELAESIQDDASEAGSVLADRAKNYGEDLLDTALDSAKSLGDTAVKHVLTSIKDKPIGTVAALVGIGFLAGYLCRRE